MTRPFHEQKWEWERLFAQKGLELTEIDCRQALDIASLEDLEDSLRAIYSDHLSGNSADIINKLTLSLEPAASFNQIISFAARAEAANTLIWGAIQAVMQSAHRNGYTIDEISSVVESIVNVLPTFDQNSKNFARAQQLQSKLQDLYDMFMDLCISSIQHMQYTCSGIAKFASYFLNPSLQKFVLSNKAKLTEQSRDIMIALADVAGSKNQHLATQTTDVSDSGLDFPITTVTSFRNYVFHGRDDILEDMHDLFTLSRKQRPQPSRFATAMQVDKREPSCFVLSGLGGIGKTQIALEYTYRNREKHDAVFWIHAGSAHLLAHEFAHIAQNLNLDQDFSGTDAEEQDRVIERVKTWLQNTRKNWLLVFDDVEHMDDLYPYYPTQVLGTGHIIITTRKPDLAAFIDPAVTRIHEVENLSPSEGAQIIWKYLQRPPGTKNDTEGISAEKISDFLGGLPLALATIGGHINQKNLSISECYEILKTSSRVWESTAVGPVRQYERSLASVFDCVFHELSDSARSLIDVLAFLDSDHIPEEIFENNLGRGILPFLSSKVEFIDCINTLRRLSLVSRSTHGWLRIHRMVQQSIILDLSKNYKHRMVGAQRAFQLVQSCLPSTSLLDVPEPGSLVWYHRYVIQLLSISSHCSWAEPPIDLPVEFTLALADMVTYMKRNGMLKATANPHEQD